MTEAAPTLARPTPPWLFGILILPFGAAVGFVQIAVPLWLRAKGLSIEQIGAGLDTLSAEEFGRFTHLNELYKSKFDFPFIFAVKGATKHQILDSFSERINNDPDDEFALAIEQICRIICFRIEDRVEV